jgi:predicted DCC family thiol-disulfide oxidoreductase YuxK
MTDGPDGSASHAVILFDGVCNLCNGFVRFIVERDPSGYFHFVSLQSELGLALLEGHDLPSTSLDSVVLVEGNRVHTRSDAVLRIARGLRGGWPLLTVFRIVPRPLRDFAYDWIAANRYRWFGRKDECMLPTPELRGRFLE